jgi:dihydropteroate synthase
VQNTPFSTNKTLNINGRLIDLSIPKIMGVLNVTPDSFYDGGRFTGEASILSQVDKMLSEGADFIDVGGYSSRPGAADISVDEEKRRTVTTVSSIAQNFPGTIISVDTFRSAVAEEAVGAGASMVNDISGGSLDPEMLNIISRLGVPYVMMHMRGDPRTMSGQTGYTDVVREVIDYFHARIDALRPFAIKDVIIDPGFGFAKTREQSFYLLRNLEKFSILGKPVLVGLSRKSMIWKTLNVEPAGALNGTIALNMVALMKGAVIVRVHDVKEARETIKLFTSLQDDVST